MADESVENVGTDDFVPQEWKETDFTITQNGVKVRFYVKKLMPLQGMALFEKIRPGIGAALGAVRKSGGVDESAMIDIVCLVPSETVAVAMDRLFRHVTYSRSDVPEPVSLHGDIDSAFAGLEPIAIYEVLARCLCINFIGSFSALLSQMGGEDDPITSPSNTQTSLPLSDT